MPTLPATVAVRGFLWGNAKGRFCQNHLLDKVWDFWCFSPRTLCIHTRSQAKWLFWTNKFKPSLHDCICLTPSCGCFFPPGIHIASRLLCKMLYSAGSRDNPESVDQHRVAKLPSCLASSPVATPASRRQESPHTLKGH